MWQNNVRGIETQLDLLYKNTTKDTKIGIVECGKETHEGEQVRELVTTSSAHQNAIEETKNLPLLDSNLLYPSFLDKQPGETLAETYCYQVCSSCSGGDDSSRPIVIESLTKHDHVSDKYNTTQAQKKLLEDRDTKNTSSKKGNVWTYIFKYATNASWQFKK